MTGRLYIYTEADGETVIAVAESEKKLAKLLGYSPTAVSHGINRGSKRYHVVDDIEEEGEEGE